MNITENMSSRLLEISKSGEILQPNVLGENKQKIALQIEFQYGNESHKWKWNIEKHHMWFHFHVRNINLYVISASIHESAMYKQVKTRRSNRLSSCLVEPDK